MSDTSFDVSSSTGAPADPARHYAPDLSSGSLDLIPDTLDLLRERADEVAAAEIKSTTVPNATDTIRLVCRGNIASKEVQRWNRKALPPVARKSGNANGLDVDNKVLYSSVLVDTTQRVEVKGRDGQWQIVQDVEHNVLTFGDPALLNAFGALDAPTALVKIYGRDSDLVKAGMAVLTGAGWTEGATGYEHEDDDDSDPTV
jgi:hypothetical protein